MCLQQQVIDLSDRPAFFFFFFFLFYFENSNAVAHNPSTLEKGKALEVVVISCNPLFSLLTCSPLSLTCSGRALIISQLRQTFTCDISLYAML
jgi:hypothetical protein